MDHSGAGHGSPVAAALMEPPARFGIAAGLLALTLGLYARSLDLDPRDTPVVESAGRFYYLLALATVAGFGAMVERASRERPRLAAESWIDRYTAPQRLPTAWILPTLSLWGVTLLVARGGRWQDVLAGALLAPASVFAAMTAREHLFSDDEETRRLAGATHLAMTVAIGFIVLSLVYLFKSRSLLSTPIVFVISTLLLAQAHDGIDAFPARRVAYALVGGFAVAETGLGLNYWPSSSWLAGGVLSATLLFYALVAGAQLTRTLDRDRVARYAGVTGALFLLCAALAR